MNFREKNSGVRVLLQYSVDVHRREQVLTSQTLLQLQPFVVSHDGFGRADRQNSGGQKSNGSSHEPDHVHAFWP